MVTVFKRSERIPVKIGPVTFKLGPMSFSQKEEVLSQVKMVSGEEVLDHLRMGYLTMKYSIKDVAGVNLPDGSNYKCEFDDSGNLTDDCTDEIMQLQCKNELVQVAMQFMTEFKDPKVKGVKVEIPGEKSSKK